MELARIRTTFTGVAGSPWYSNHYFDDDGGLAQTYAEFVEQMWEAIGVYMKNTVAFSVGGDVAIIEDSTGEIVDQVSVTPITGTGDSGTEALPWANQALINWKTGQFLNGREVRGKTFVPGLIQSANNDGSLNGTERAAILAAANELVSDGNGALRIFSPTHLTSRPVTAVTVPTKIAVLRSRRD